MINKILVTGGLGYIGTELAKVLKKNQNIIFVDIKYNKNKINLLKKKKFKFFQGDILNPSFLKKVSKGVNIVYHLAAITKIPSVKFQANIKDEKKIKINAINGIKNIIKYTDTSCKIIFPSSHLIFEGSKIEGAFYDEKSNACPVLAYGKSKLKCEKILIKSKRKYIILRLSSVYGYNGDERRMFNVPNLFAKRAKKNYSLKLFAGGIQVKSIVSVRDVANAFLFFSSYLINNQIFNVSSENLKIIDMAKMCIKYRPKTRMIKTNHEIPNLGYRMNNAKIQKFNFKFKNSYDKFLKSYLK